MGSGNKFIQGWVKSFPGFIFITLLLEFMTPHHDEMESDPSLVHGAPGIKKLPE